jgi:3-methyladenine DNA glycosylase Tag
MGTTYEGPEQRAYAGPERRSVITFTREDSERLVRVEQQVAEINQRLKAILENANDQTKRINDLERSQSWLWGLGSAFAFISTAVVIFLKTRLL